MFQLRKDGLMNNDKTYVSTFNFMIEELDAKFVAGKDYSELREILKGYKYEMSKEYRKLPTISVLQICLWHSYHGCV